MRKGLGVIVFIMLTTGLFGQVGGLHAFEFLNLTSSPTVAALGGKLISNPATDLSLVYYNPALLTNEMRKNFTLNYVNYFAGVNYGYVSLAEPFRDSANIAFGIQYINYGTFTGADEAGLFTYPFYAAEYAFNFTGSYPINDRINAGVDIRPILSVYEHYQSFGISTDYGLTYKNPEKLYTLAFVIRNLGTQIVPYYKGNYESLPFEIQFGYTQKLKYAPFIFSITAHHLEMPDLSVKAKDSGTESTSTSSSQNPSKKGIEKATDLMMRHIIFGVEFVPLKNFYFRLGYNYQRRQEMKIDSRASTVGFSWGFGLSVSRFQINFGRATYHLAGASNVFSISTNLSELFTRSSK